MAIYNLDTQPNTLGSTSQSAQPSFFETAVDMHVEGMWHSLSYLPDPKYRSFHEWILKQGEIKDRWLQLTAVIQQIVLAEKLLGSVLTSDELSYILPYCVELNTYLTYEVVSDNLAIGLSKRDDGDTTYDERRQLLQVFNHALSQRIRGQSDEESKSILLPLKPLTQMISAFDQSLNPLQHERIAAAFLAQNGDVAHAEDLKFGLYSTLVANMETCLSVQDVMSDFEFYPSLQDKLARRYEGVNQLLGDDDLSLEQLVEIGTDTILIVPVVGYYVAVIGEMLRPSPGYKTIVEDGTLLKALQEAATLVRLLNDMGTAVLEQTPDERRTMLAHMRGCQHDYESFDQLLLNVTEAYGSPLTRIKKDLKFGEFNVGLHAALEAADMADAITIFEQNLADLSALYQTKQVHLNQTVKHLSHQLGGAAIAEVIVRVVKFHQAIYRQSFEDGSGEYAI